MMKFKWMFWRKKSEKKVKNKKMKEWVVEQKSDR